MRRVVAEQHRLVHRLVCSHHRQQLCSGGSSSSSSRAGVVARGAKDRQPQLAHVAPENRQEVSAILDIAERSAQGSWEVAFTHFISPPVAADALAALRQMGGLAAVAWGGYPQAERVRLALGREELLLAAVENPAALGPEAVAALDVRGNFMFDAASHRDFLGALVGTGVVRDRIGDILLQGEGGAQVLVEPGLVEHFETALTQVRTVPVTCRAVALSELRVAPPKKQAINSVEASLRLDAVASAGFRMSRAKMADLIKGGDVRLNWRPASKPSVEVAAGDVVSVTGKGRLEVLAVSVNKKGKYAVSMERLV